MGRRKIDIQPLTNERNRLVTFQKRKNGLFKKAYELGVLCSVDVAVIIFTPGQNNKLFEFCSSNIDDMVLRRLNYEGERDLKTTMDFINGGGQLKGASSAVAGMAESESDDDDLSDTKPSKRKASGTRSRPARTITPTTDNLPVYRSDSPQTIISSAESLPRSSAFSISERSATLLDRSRSDDHPTPSRHQGNTILRPGSSASNPDYRRTSHLSLLRSGLKSDWPSPRLDNGPSNGSLLGSSALMGFDGHHSGHHHQELLSNFARHRASTLAQSGGGPGTGRRLTAPYPAATPPLPPTSLTGGAGSGSGGGGGGGDDSWLDFLAMPSTSMSLSLLADHPTALGGSHASAAGGYDFPFSLGLGGAGRGGSGSGSGGGGGLGIGSYGLSEGADLDKERELLAREGGNDFGPRKRPRWE